MINTESGTIGKNKLEIHDPATSCFLIVTTLDRITRDFSELRCLAFFTGNFSGPNIYFGYRHNAIAAANKPACYRIASQVLA